MTSFFWNFSGARRPPQATASVRQIADRVTTKMKRRTVVGSRENYNNLEWMPRFLGVDVGERRLGLAISHATGVLARPLVTIHVSGRHDAVAQVASEIQRLADEDDGVSAVVVGVPRALDGSATEQTQRVEAFVAALRRATTIPVHTADERLTSREAESRLAERQRDWRARKRQLDAAAAAIILQDFLDNLDRRAR
jgi:putative Holliday junction resolvase